MTDSARSGLIPAHAGKTLCGGGRGHGGGAHPRSRGENLLNRGSELGPKGSSPLTRGKRRAGHVGGRRTRLIPAHAGKTTRSLKPSTGSRAHPRSRGENCDRSRTRPSVEGSSPLTRGKQTACGRPAAAARLIPAHAGKTIGVIGFICGLPAHPRSRGENRAKPALSKKRRGSSPLTRGKRVAGRPQLGADRLIPAHAGKTRSARLR